MALDLHTLKYLGISLEDEMEQVLREELGATLKQELRKEVTGLTTEQKLEALEKIRSVKQKPEKPVENADELTAKIMEYLK